MSDSERVDRWQRTRGHLSRAWTALPGGDDSELTWSAEFLDHNELELAMDELALIADHPRAPAAVWQALADAAVEMDLSSRAHEFTQRITPGNQST